MHAVHVPAGPGIRLDAGYEAGDTVSPYYDSLLAKLCAWGADRAEALARMRGALAECAYVGVQNTIGFHRHVLEQPAFVHGQHDTSFVERHWPPGRYLSTTSAEAMAAGAALTHYLRRRAPASDGDSRAAWAAAGRLAATRRAP